jgi:hypothetical protein
MVVELMIKRSEQNNVLGQKILLKNKIDEETNLCI